MICEVKVSPLHGAEVPQTAPAYVPGVSLSEDSFLHTQSSLSTGGHSCSFHLYKVNISSEGLGASTSQRADGARRTETAYLGGCPVNPAFAIGVNVHQDKPFDQVWEDQLQPNRHRLLLTALQDWY